MAKYNFLLFATLFLVMLPRGFSLKCYNCTEISDTKCGDPFKKTGEVECASKTDVCVKHKTPAIGLDGLIDKAEIKATLHRGCKPKDFCTTVQQFSEHCSTCNSNLCNSSSLLMPSFAFISLLCIFKTILTKLTLN